MYPHEDPQDPVTVQRRQLDRLLSYKGKLELDLDQETLRRLRSAGTPAGHWKPADVRNGGVS